MSACPWCREDHHPERRLSFSRFGVEGCDIYRSRIATFPQGMNDDDRKRLGPLFAAAPELVEALQSLLKAAPAPKGVRRDFSYMVHREAAVTALEKAGVCMGRYSPNVPESAALHPGAAAEA